jgi:TonB family protein
MKRFAVAMLLVLAASTARADTCVPSDAPWSMLSKNGQWRLDGSQTRRKDGWRGALFHKTARGAWRRHARWRFVNQWGPGGAAVANDGTVVTYENICQVGFGPDIIVIYRPDGKLVRSLRLSDLLIEDDIKLLPHSVNYMQWADTRSIDEDTRRIVFDLNEPQPQKNVQLAVSLDTGELLTEKRRRFVGFPTLDPVVSFHADAELLTRATSLVAPAYPQVAMKARIWGDVIVEVVVGEKGEIESVKIIKPLPFGLDQAADEAVHKWRFLPGGRTTGRVVMSFGILRQPPMPID